MTDIDIMDKAGWDLPATRLGDGDVKRLRQPFAAVKFLPQGKAAETMKGVKMLAYIDSSLVRERLSEVDPRWTATYRRLGATVDEWKQLNYATECTVILFGVARTDVGYAGGGIEPMKAAYSDALKRGALGHGVGSFLRDSSWSFWLPSTAQDANGKGHTMFTTWLNKGTNKWNFDIKPAGRTYLLAEYRKVLAQPAFKAHYGEPVEYGDVDEVLDAAIPDDASPDEGEPDTMTDAEVETLVLLASYTGRKTGADANRRKFQQPGMVFERQLVQLLPQVQAHLELSADGVTAVREWANDAASGEPGMFDALSEGLVGAQGAKE